MSKRKSDIATGASAKQRKTDDEPRDFQGVVIGTALYLVCTQTQRCFESERRDGRLVYVGQYNSSTKVIDAPAPVEADSTTQSDDSNVVQAAPTATATASAESENIEFPYPVDDADHCETSASAYVDIAPLLQEIANKMGKTKSELRIYDPYFCQGAMVRHLAALGFTNVYNKCEDFYAVQARGAGPEFDVLITNPPYSGDHVERILRFCVASGKPWFLLVPNYVYRKPFYTPCLRQTSPIYLTPAKRYGYQSPSFLRSDLRKGDLATSPFLSFWYIDMGSALNRWAIKNFRSTGPDEQSETPSVTGDLKFLPRKYMDSFDPNRKKLRKNQRDALKRKQNENSR